MDGKKKTKRAKGAKKQGKDDLFKSLKTKIGITREEFDKSHKEFHNLCPNGQMTKEQFLEKSKETLGAGPMTGSLFRVFDEDDRSEYKYQKEDFYLETLKIRNFPYFYFRLKHSINQIFKKLF